MAKLFRNITLDFIIDLIGLIRSVILKVSSLLLLLWTKCEKRPSSVFISKLFGFKWESGVTVFVVIRPHCGHTGLAFILTYNVEFYGQSNTDYTPWSYITTVYSLQSTVLCWPPSQQGFVYPALSQMTGGIREHVLQLVSLGHQETDVLIVPFCCWHILNEEKNVLKIFLLLQILFPPTKKGGTHIQVEFVESVRLWEISVP